jgi:multidrug efflux pump subunit AcrB
VLDLAGATFFGNLIILMVLLVILNRYLLDDAIRGFQNRVLPGIMRRYERSLRWALKGWRPAWLLLATFGLLIVSFIAIGVAVATRHVSIVFFPSGDPNQIYVYLKMPIGTDVAYTDSVTQVLENRVYKVLGMQNGKENPVVESVISNIAVGASDPTSGDRSTRPERGRIQISFVEFEKRHGVSTAPYLDSIRKVMTGMPGAEISVSKQQSGPPTEPPVNIEIASENFDDLTKTAVSLKNYLDSIQVPGVEELKMDIDLTNPEISLTVDRERALAEGISFAQIGQTIRTAVFGREVSKIKEGEEEYKIQLRNLQSQRTNLADLLNMHVSYFDMNRGFRSIPLAQLVKVDYTSTLGSVKRKNQKRVITLTSNVLETQGFTPASVNQALTAYLADFKKKPEAVTISQTGESAQQAETGAFLGKALIYALMLILLILVLQFNSISKPVIIITEILFSVIGVLLGFALTGMTISIVMTGIGIVGLAGIVVKNGILVIEFADELRARGLKTREAVIQAGKTRIIPVLLTALAAILGFLPIAFGFNINFITLFSDLNPHIFFGGDSVAFWKPLSWTIIFGLAFAFFMTLLMVPAMYLISERLRRPMRRMYGGKWVSFLGIPPLTLLFIPLVFATMIAHRREVVRRKRKLANQNDTINKAFIGSWF